MRLGIVRKMTALLVSEPPVGPGRSTSVPSNPWLRTPGQRLRVTDDGVLATLIDLAARNVVEVEWRGPEVFSIRLRPSTDEPLTDL